jgi:hypothetical protein
MIHRQDSLCGQDDGGPLSLYLLLTKNKNSAQNTKKKKKLKSVFLTKGTKGPGGGEIPGVFPFSLFLFFSSTF